MNHNGPNPLLQPKSQGSTLSGCAIEETVWLPMYVTRDLDALGDGDILRHFGLIFPEDNHIRATGLHLRNKDVRIYFAVNKRQYDVCTPAATGQSRQVFDDLRSALVFALL